MREVTRTEWLDLRRDVQASIACSIRLCADAQLLRSATTEGRIVRENEQRAGRPAAALSAPTFVSQRV